MPRGGSLLPLVRRLVLLRTFSAAKAHTSFFSVRFPQAFCLGGSGLHVESTACVRIDLALCQRQDAHGLTIGAFCLPFAHSDTDVIRWLMAPRRNQLEGRVSIGITRQNLGKGWKTSGKRQGFPVLTRIVCNGSAWICIQSPNNQWAGKKEPQKG